MVGRVRSNVERRSEKIWYKMGACEEFHEELAFYQLHNQAMARQDKI
jgi:hypothetical protein